MSKKPESGPEFREAASWLHRAEYAVATLAVLAYILWRGLALGGIDILQTVFWAVFPDVASFIPIGLSSKRKEWPWWGANSCNVFHTVLVWGSVFAVTWAVLRVPYQPMLAWLGHITADRATGFGLREPSSENRRALG